MGWNGKKDCASKNIRPNIHSFFRRLWKKNPSKYAEYDDDCSQRFADGRFSIIAQENELKARAEKVDLTAIRLLRWYDANRRELPWRRSREPYRVWLSEIMLKQTKVATVIPYFETFVERFPAVVDLAAAPLDEVLAMWSGLGYYRRARWMHRTAIEIAEGGGRFPKTARELEALPGIGSYTAAAIASIAFDEVVAVVDGNVERVVSRMLGLREDPKSARARSRIIAAATSRLDPRRPGDSNQAMMELGATVCRPRRPECSSCPLASGCRARESGSPESFPKPRRRRRTEPVERLVALVVDGERVLLFRRPEDSELLAGLWELPQVPWQENRKEMERALAESYGGRWRLGKALQTVRHSITFRALRLRVFEAEVEGWESVAEGMEAARVALKERERYACSSQVEKILRGC